MRAVTAETMQGLDRQAIELYGVSGIELMERAGGNVAEIINSRFCSSGVRTALVLAGKGNNGGDGFVVARLLAEADWQVSLLLFSDADAFTGDAKANFEKIPSSVSRYHFSSISLAAIQGFMQDAAVVIDAMFGTGLTRPLSGIYPGAIRLLNSCARPVVAVDIPSGVDATSGAIRGEAVRADITVTFGVAKTGQFLYPGAEYVGELIVTDIGIPSDLLDKTPFVEIIDAKYAADLLKPRKRTAHKGSSGHCLIIAGSCGKSGAAAMTANSAMRSGAGLVTLAVPSSIHSLLELKTTEAMTMPLSEAPGGTLSAASIDEIKTLFSGRDVVAIGPGLGLTEGVKAVVRGTVCTAKVALVLDADALNALAGDLSPLKISSATALILTPHPGEMARLAGSSVEAIESDRVEAAKSFAAANSCFLVLKGARTVVAAPDGRTAINSSGNPGMASGGMGDVLTGVITALLGQGYEPFAACCLGVFCHGLAGDMVAAEKGEIGLIATDLQEMLPYAFKRLSGKKVE